MKIEISTLSAVVIPGDWDADQSGHAAIVSLMFGEYEVTRWVVGVGGLPWRGLMLEEDEYRRQELERFVAEKLATLFQPK